MIFPVKQLKAKKKWNVLFVPKKLETTNCGGSLNQNN